MWEGGAARLLPIPIRRERTMSKIRTHYDNLKVARDAPPEVIRAAYKGLSQKYHPDRNQGDKNSEKIMRLINQAYEVLSDPAKRKAHDEWILSMEETSGISNHINEGVRIKPESAPNVTKSERDLKYPLHWAHYLKKYKVNEDQVREAVALGMVKGALYDGVLYLEDKPPYGIIKSAAHPGF